MSNFNIDSDYLKKRKELQAKRSIKVKIGDVVYDSMVQAANRLNVSAFHIRNQLKKGGMVDGKPITRVESK